MKKSDLIAGKHFVELRNGIICFVYEGYYKVELVSLLSTETSINEYNENLLDKDGMNEFDIMKVGISKPNGVKGLFDGIEWFWIRDEVKEMTVADIEKELGYTIKVVK